MLKLFRKIRQRLVTENKFSKYLLYAIGEIILVVIGILIALQINNNNEARKSAEFEKKLLGELHTATQRNIQQIKFEIQKDSSYKTSCKLIQDYLEKDLEYNDSLDEHFSKTIRWRTVLLNYSAYQTTKTYGLHHLKNDTIRNLLTSIYEFKQAWITKIAKRQHDYHTFTVAPVLADLFETATTFSNTLKPLDFKTLKQSKHYINILKTNALNRERELLRFRDLLKNLNELESLLAKELGL